MTEQPEAVAPEPCPFCGGSVRLGEGAWGQGYPCHWAKCDECDAEIEKPTKAEAIAAWNTRAEATRTPEAGDTRRGDGEYQIDGSIYDGMEAAISKDGRTIAHVWKYADAIDILAALTAKPVDGVGVPGNLMASYRHWAARMERDVCAVDLTEEEVEDLAQHLATALRTQSAVSDGVLPQDVVELVIAAREVAFSGLFDGNGDEADAAIRALDKASEAFASRVPWENEDEA